MADKEILFSLVIDDPATPPTLLWDCWAEEEKKTNSGLRKAELTYSQQANCLGKPFLNSNDDKEQKWPFPITYLMKEQ